MQLYESTKIGSVLCVARRNSDSLDFPSLSASNAKSMVLQQLQQTINVRSLFD